PARPVGITVKPPPALRLFGPDIQPGWGNLWTPPLRFGRRPPQSNYPPDTVPTEDFRRLVSPTDQGGVPLAALWASHLRSTDQQRTQYQGVVKLHGVFPSYRGEPASSQAIQFNRASR